MPRILAIHRRSSRIRLILGATLLLGMAGGSCKKKPEWDPPGIPTISEVRILPAVIYAAPGTSFELRARVLSAARRVIDINGYEQITIEWSSATPGVSFSDPKANPVTVTLPATGGIVIEDLTARVTRDVKRPHGPEFDTYDALATVRIAGPGTPPFDKIHVGYSPDRAPVAVLLDAMEADGCVDDWILAVVKTAELGRDLVDGCAPAPELAVFATGHEMVFKDNTALGPWKVGPDVRNEDPLPEPLFRRFAVIVGLDVDTGVVRQWVLDEIKRAHALLDKNRAGIRLYTASDPFVHGHLGAIDSNIWCMQDSINYLLQKSGFDISADPDLFVLFVDEIVSGIKGLVCPPTGSTHGRVIYLPWKQHQPTTTVHELGHALSLRHATEGGSFEMDNLMWDSDDWEVRSRRDAFSVGQIFRMNLHDASWLNGVLVPPQLIARHCQDGSAPGTCPAVDRNLGEPGSE